MTTEQTVPTATLDETLEKTDLGHVINENKKPIMIGGVIIVIIIIAISIFKYQSDQKEMANLQELYEFKQKVLTPFVEGKTKSDQFMKDIATVPTHGLKSAYLLPSILQAADKLQQSNNNAEALFLLEKWASELNNKSYAFFFTALKLVPQYENLGKVDEAIGLLESLIAVNRDVLKGKLYLDLGRLYFKKENLEKAKTHFNYVIEKYENTDYAKMAKLYLLKLK